MGLIATVFVFLGSVLSSILATEFKEWTPWIVKNLIRCSVARLPQDRQKRFQEEWTSHVKDVPGDIGKVVVAFGFLMAAFKMSLFLSASDSSQRSRKRGTRKLARGGSLVPPIGEGLNCHVPVASRGRRMVAAAMDAGVVLAGVMVFLSIFFLSGRQVVMNRETVPLLTGVTSVIALFYRALWCFAGADTPGVRFVGLRMVDFEGRRPDREQRGLRQVASLLSLLSAGLGIMWALVDEENLAWHDHISKTFLTSE